MLGCVPIGALGQEPPDPNLTAEERAELISLLDESFDMLLSLITDLSDEQWDFKQNEDRWSVGECAEHMVRSERALLDAVFRAIENGVDEDWFQKTEGKADLLRRVMPNRNPFGAVGTAAPVEMRPTEHWNRDTLFKEFYKMRGEVRAFIETTVVPGVRGISSTAPVR